MACKNEQLTAVPTAITLAPTANAPTRPADNLPLRTRRPTPDLVSPISLAPAFENLNNVCLSDLDQGPDRKIRVPSVENLFEIAAKAGKADGKAGKSGKSQSVLEECSSPAEKYRTCFHRSVTLDTCDTISSGKPHVASNEVLIGGTMHLVLLQDDSLVTCEKKIQLEKAMLTYLADNVGDSTYEPVCVFAGDYATSTQLVPDSRGDYVQSTAIEIGVQYIHKKSSAKIRSLQQLEDDVRRLKSSQCTRADNALCCSQHAINNYIGEYCASLGCRLNNCGSGRRRRKPSPDLSRKLSRSVSSNYYTAQRRTGKAGKGSKASLFHGKSKSSKSLGKSHKAGKADHHSVAFNTCPWYGMLHGDDFNEVVKKYSSFNPKMTQSILGAKDTTSVAICSANRYSIDEMGTPSLYCSEFVAERCIENQDNPQPTTEEPTPAPVTPAPQPNPTDPPVASQVSIEPTFVVSNTSQVSIAPTLAMSNPPQGLPTLPPVSGAVPTLPPSLSTPAVPTLPPLNTGGLPTLPPVSSQPPMNSVFTPAPSSSTISVSPWNFENGVFPEIPWRTGGNGAFTIDTEKVDEGSYSIKSPNLESASIAGPQISNATLTIDNDFAGGLVKARVFARSVHPQFQLDRLFTTSLQLIS
jgi:hypothetical protein